MDHNEIIAYGLNQPGTTVRYPFDPLMPVLFVGEKMFALLGSFQGCPSVNLKCDPDSAWLIREKYPKAVFPGYHMNKRHWNTVLLDGTVPSGELRELVDESYQLVLSKMTKRERERIVTSRAESI